MFFPKKITEEEIKNYQKYQEYVLDVDSLESSTSFGRFKERLIDWSGQPSGYLEHHLWWVLHNCVAHPVLGILPSKRTVEFHDWASKKLNQHAPHWRKPKETNSPIPIINNRMAWIKHNVIAHLGIGLFPCLKTFHYHDLTAIEMAVDGWV